MNPCQECGKCCKEFWEYITSKDLVVRFSWLETDKITVKKVKESMWKVTYHYPCTLLLEVDGVYSCKQYNGFRPAFCKEYPDNLSKEQKVLERKFCKLIR